jgi:hypothetical protein
LEVAQRIDRVTAGVESLQHAFGVRQETGANLGEAHASPGALEEALTEVALEGLDACGDGGLRQEQGLGRAAEAVLVRNLDECF